MHDFITENDFYRQDLDDFRKWVNEQTLEVLKTKIVSNPVYQSIIVSRIAILEQMNKDARHSDNYVLGVIS